MKIADLFVSLGFKIDGPDVLPNVDRNLMKANVSALGLLATLTALNAAFYAMMARGVEAAVGLDRFDRSTGGLAEDLQKVQYGAARANVSTKAIADAFKVIQKTRAEISLGNVDASSPWFMLGIDPREDPRKVMDQLREAVQKLEPALAATFVSRMGFSDEILYLLQQKKTLGSLFVSQEDTARLTALGGAWKGFLFNLSVVATKFASAFGDQLARVVTWLDRGVFLMERFVRWLNSGTTGANAFRSVLFGIVILMGVLTLALGGVVALLGLLKGALVAIQLIPIVAALTALVGVLLLMAGALVGLVLLIQDFWTQIDGGKSLFDWNQGLVLTIKNVERLASAIQTVLDTWRQLRGDTNFAKAFAVESGKAALSYGSGYGFARDFANWNWQKREGGGATQNTANVEVHVNGAEDPAATGREVGRNVDRAISDAFGMAPLPTN